MWGGACKQEKQPYKYAEMAPKWPNRSISGHGNDPIFTY